MQAPANAHCITQQQNKDGLKDTTEENSFTSMEDKILWSRLLDFSTYNPHHPFFFLEHPLTMNAHVTYTTSSSRSVQPLRRFFYETALFCVWWLHHIRLSAWSVYVCACVNTVEGGTLYQI